MLSLNHASTRRQHLNRRRDCAHRAVICYLSRYLVTTQGALRLGWKPLTCKTDIVRRRRRGLALWFPFTTHDRPTQVLDGASCAYFCRAQSQARHELARQRRDLRRTVAEAMASLLQLAPSVLSQLVPPLPDVSDIPAAPVSIPNTLMQSDKERPPAAAIAPWVRASESLAITFMDDCAAEDYLEDAWGSRFVKAFQSLRSRCNQM